MGTSLRLHTDGWYLNEVFIPKGIGMLKALASRSWLSLALYCLSKAGWPHMHLLARSDQEDKPIDIVILYRSLTVKNTYSTMGDSSC